MARVVRDTKLVVIEAPKTVFRLDDGTQVASIEADGTGTGLFSSFSGASFMSLPVTRRGLAAHRAKMATEVTNLSPSDTDEAFDRDPLLSRLADSDEFAERVNAAWVDVMTRTLTDAVLFWGVALGMGTVVEVYADVASAVATASEAGLVSGLQPPASDCLQGLRVTLKEQMTRAGVLWAAYVALAADGFGPLPAPLVARASGLAEWASGVFEADTGFDELVEGMKEQLSTEVVLGAGAALGVAGEIASTIGACAERENA